MVFDRNAELHIKGLEIDWDKIESDSYLRNIPSIAKVDDIRFNKQITFFVGENGSGKSTLLEAIAVAYGFNPEGGTRNYSFSTYDSHSELLPLLLPDTRIPFLHQVLYKLLLPIHSMQ